MNILLEIAKTILQGSWKLVCAIVVAAFGLGGVYANVHYDIEEVTDKSKQNEKIITEMQKDIKDISKAVYRIEGILSK